MTTIHLTTVSASPVVSSLMYTDAIVPRNGGGWNWISQWYQYPNTVPSDWVVMHLEDGAYHLDHDPPLAPGAQPAYCNSNFTHTTQLRAPNGRVFFPATSGYLWYYDPNTEIVTRLPQLGSTVGLLYSAIFNHDGSTLFFGTLGSSKTSKLPWVLKVDPTTLVTTRIAVVGSGGHSLNAYAYYIRADNGATPWLYVLVGEDIWDVVAVNLTTGVATVIETATLNAFASFQLQPEGWVVNLYTNHGLAGQTLEQFWLVDGVKYPFTPLYDPAALPFTPRNCTPYTNPTTNPPSLDYSLGPERILWAPNGSSTYTENDYQLAYPSPVAIESLVKLPDNSLLGSCYDYNGFFRYGSNVLTYFGQFPGVTEGTARCVANGKAYISGYPNAPLYEYDPDLSWDTPGGTNPKLLGHYSDGTTFSGVKHATNLVYSTGSNRIYMCGTRDRSGSGAGVGYYDFGSHAFGGRFTNLQFYAGNYGLAVFDGLSRVVFSGLIGDNPSYPGQTPTVSSLFLFDMNLNQIETQNPIGGLLDTGYLLRTDEASVVVGFSSLGLIYRWDIVSKALLGTVDISGYGALRGRTLVQTASDAAIVVMGSGLYRIHLKTLNITSLGTFDFTPGGSPPDPNAISNIVLVATRYYMPVGSNLDTYAPPNVIPLIDPAILFPSAVAGAALGVPDFFDVLIETLNALCAQLSLATLDENLLRADAANGLAQPVPTFWGTIVTTVNACAFAMSQPQMATDLLVPSSKTGKAIDATTFYVTVIAKVNDLINHL